MITLDQVRLLDEKIESCLARIAELNAENDALRRKCAELTNALSAKSESLSSFQQDQNKIEEGILKALERLNAVESSILSVANGVQPTVQPAVGASVNANAQSTVANNSPVGASHEASVGASQVQQLQHPAQPIQNPQPTEPAQVQMQQPAQPQQPIQQQQPVQPNPTTGSTGSPTVGSQSQDEYDAMPTFDIF